ncbi:MAG: hypothetical protein D6711_18905 [Chloroflexi bacterium]|nr:MAG: hypothetical protein D6711_18905 [Chloroflexota bacterium]
MLPFCFDVVVGQDDVDLLAAFAGGEGLGFALGVDDGRDGDTLTWFYVKGSGVEAAFVVGAGNGSCQDSCVSDGCAIFAGNGHLGVGDGLPVQVDVAADAADGLVVVVGGGAARDAGVGQGGRRWWGGNGRWRYATRGEGVGDDEEDGGQQQAGGEQGG